MQTPGEDCVAFLAPQVNEQVWPSIGPAMWGRSSDPVVAGLGEMAGGFDDFFVD